jgi:hypothetical protein
VRGAHSRKAPARGDDLEIACLLEPKLNDVDPAAQRRFQEAVVQPAADEVQAGGSQAAAPIVP